MNKKEDFIEAGRILFHQPCTFVLGVAQPEQVPPADRLEIAFAGRSNVGKSSLINALVRRKDLARASSTPGRTQQLNYFNLADSLYLVDLPGYGFANAPEKNVRLWNSLVFSYLKGRPSLRRVFLLIDSRQGITKKDLEVMEMLDKAAVSYQIVLTKADKLKSMTLEKIKNETQEQMKNHTACYPDLIVTSSEKNFGIEAVRVAIAELLAH